MTSRTPTPRAPTVSAAIALRDAIGRFSRRLRQTRPIAELTVTQVSALSLLDRAGAMTPRELAEVERVQPPTMTRIVGRLEEKGLVQRTPHPTDGRQVILAPSPAGRRLVREYRRVGNEWLARRLDDLTAEERETLRRAADILAKLARD